MKRQSDEGWQQNAAAIRRFKVKPLAKMYLHNTQTDNAAPDRPD
jgi:hypothetical protein